MNWKQRGGHGVFTEIMEYLYKKLKEYEVSGHYGFHMPGHKRNIRLTGDGLPYGIDITEIEGFDDLHHPRGILKEAQERAARVCHAEETHYLINGSTTGLLCAILGCTERGDRILMARNCHRAVYNAVFMNALRPVYIYPQHSEIGDDHTERADINGEIPYAHIAEMLEKYPDIRAVVITSPTYDGIVSDVAKIAGAAHRKGIPLILDEAHGAHFGFHPYFPRNGNELGADIVIHSLHKTLPSLTQTALLHMNGNIIDRSRVRMYLHMLQTSSPSYVLMASMDECIRILDERSEEIFDRYTELLERTRRKLKEMRYLSLGETSHYDCSKLLVLLPGIKRGRDGWYSGKQLYDELNETYLLQMEMAAPGYVIGMTSLADTEEGMERLTEALYKIDGRLAGIDGIEPADSKTAGAVSTEYGRNEQVYPTGDMEKFRNRLKYIQIERCSGYISAEYAYVYPPGIPLVVPGERISEETMEQLVQYRELGFDIEGTDRKGKIGVLENE